MSDPSVRTHLLHVAATLRRETPATLPAERRAARLDALDALEAYARAGRFPRPDGPVTPRARRAPPPRAFAGPGRRAPIFEDAAGTRCAVGHLLGRARPDLVARIRAADNGAYLPELRLPEPDMAALHDWARATGFTADELAWIQPGYCWEVPTCDEHVLEAPPAHEQVCDGPDASLQGASYWYTGCQECDGPYRVWAWVTNAGTEDATGVVVELLAGDRVLDAMTDVIVPAGQVLAVGPLETESVRDLADIGRIRVTAPGDCWGDWDTLTGWETGNGGPGYVEPAECGGGCDETGETGGPVEDPGNDDPDGRPPGAGEPVNVSSCGTGSAAALLLGVSVLGAASRRRRG